MSRERRATRIALLIILAVAAWLRLWNLTQGLPGLLHPDEGPVLDPIKRVMFSGSLNPRFFIYPALQIYLTAGVAAAAYPFVSVAGVVGSWAQYCLHELCLATIGRGLVAAFGIGTVLLAYGVAKSMRSPRAGLAAAAFMAVCPYHALDTRYTNVDVPMAFWGLASLWCVLSYARTGKPTKLWLGAALVGVATATKYLGVLFFVPVALAATASPSPKSWKEVLRRLRLVPLLFAATTGCFFALAPYTLIDYPSFSATMGHEMRYGYQSQFGWDLSPRGIIYHKFTYQLLASLPFTLGLGVYVVTLLGLVAVWRSCRETRGVFLAGVGTYFLLVGSLEHIFPRYLVPLLPMLCVAAGVGWATGVTSGVRWRRVLVRTLCVVGLLHSGLMAATMADELDPHVGYSARDWITRNVRPGSTVAASYLQHMIPFVGADFRVVRLEPSTDWHDKEAPECVVVDGWTLMGLERAPHAHPDALTFFRGLGRADSAYRLAQVFEPKYFTEALYARLDPQFRNQFESACLRMYLRK